MVDINKTKVNKSIYCTFPACIAVPLKCSDLVIFPPNCQPDVLCCGRPHGCRDSLPVTVRHLSAKYAMPWQKKCFVVTEKKKLTGFFLGPAAISKLFSIVDCDR